MPPHYGRFIAYFRVSTDRQGKSGLGLAAQREAVMSYLDGGRWALVDEFTEVESGKRNDRPEPVKAFAACKKQKAKLVIAKLDRLSRNLPFIATLMDSGVEFIAVDNPHAHCGSRNHQTPNLKPSRQRRLNPTIPPHGGPATSGECSSDPALGMISLSSAELPRRSRLCSFTRPLPGPPGPLQ
jgi:Resolvase, N terminal domain